LIDKPSYDSTKEWKKAIHDELLRPLYWSGWDAVFKVRCSQGLQIRAMVSSVGNLLPPSSMGGSEDEVEFSVVTPETCLAVTLEHRIGGMPSPRDNAKHKNFAYVQTALLYTNPWTGDRRVRVSTLAIKVTSNASEILPSVDFGALAALQLRLNLPHANYSSASKFTLANSGSTYTVDATIPDQRGDSIVTDARHDMFTAMRQVLVAHRGLCVQNGHTIPSGRLVITKSLKPWPLFVASAAKSPLLRRSTTNRRRNAQQIVPSPRADERAYYMYHARKVSPAAAMLLVSPLLLDLKDEKASFEWQNLGSSYLDPLANLKNSPVVDLPPPMPTSISNLAADGIYLLDTCFAIYVLVEKEAGSIGDQPALQSKVFRASQQLRLWSQVGNVPSCLRPTAGLPVVVVHQKKDQARYQALLRYLVLDPTPHDKDFPAYCKALQSKILKYS